MALSDAADKKSFLWQRALFKEEKSPRTIANSLRMRLHLLNVCQERKNDPDYYHLMQTKMIRYGSVVDSQKPEVGLNNYADQIQALVGNGTNHSREWKCGISIEDVLQMPECKALTQQPLQEVSTRPFPLLDSVTPPVIPTVVVKSVISTSAATPTSRASIVQSNVAPPTQTMSSERPSLVTSTAGKFQYPIAPSLPSRSRDRPQSEAKDKAISYSNGYQRKEDTFNKKQNQWRKRKRRGQYDSADNDDEEESDSLSGRGRGGVASFVTAKDQYRINQYKTKERGRGCYRGDEEDMDTDGPISSGNYGNNKRSLGTRRTTGSKFVPPVKRNSEEDDPDISEKIRSHVLCNKSRGGGPNEGGDGVLPPELEGDERLKNIDPKMVELIMNEIMDHGAPVQWDDIAGLEYAKCTIKEIVVWPMLRPDIFKGLRGPPKGILLFGPPGTGKTLIGKCIASQVKATFFSISASSLTSKWVGEGEKMVRALFAVSRCYQPAVIFIDEIDSLLSQRSDTEHESSRRIKTEFLVQLDGATTSDDDRLLVVGATNRPQEIDEAARRRLVKRLYIPLPEGSARRQIVSNLLRDQSYELNEQELDWICEKTGGYSGADMTNLCREAALGPIRDAAHDIQNIAVDQVRPVKCCDFEDALHTIRPSVSESDLELYINWNNKYGCGSKR